MIERIVVFLVRKKLHLKKYQSFTFSNQKKQCYYFFDKDGVYRYFSFNPIRENVMMENIIYATETRYIDINGMRQISPSNVSLNYILSDECEIEKYDI